RRLPRVNASGNTRQAAKWAPIQSADQTATARVYDSRKPGTEMGIPVGRLEMDTGICEWNARLAFKCTLVLGVAAVALMAVAMPAAAQTSYGSVVGTVADATSSNIPGATVALINLGTAERRSAETDVSGNYQFVNLVPGNYKLEIEKSGF